MPGAVHREKDMSEFGNRLFHDEDGTRGECGNFTRDASEKKPTYVAQPAAAEDDQISFVPPRFPRNRRRDRAMGQERADFRVRLRDRL